MSLTDILSAEAIENAIKDCEGELMQNETHRRDRWGICLLVIKMN